MKYILMLVVVLLVSGCVEIKSKGTIEEPKEFTNTVSYICVNDVQYFRIMATNNLSPVYNLNGTLKGCKDEY